MHINLIYLTVYNLTVYNHLDFCPFTSFDSLPGIDDLNSYEMPHSKKLVNAKEAFKVNHAQFVCS